MKKKTCALRFKNQMLQSCLYKQEKASASFANYSMFYEAMTDYNLAKMRSTEKARARGGRIRRGFGVRRKGAKRKKAFIKQFTF